ncbi:MAG: APC family permease [Rickettsiales bacterium]
MDSHAPASLSRTLSLPVLTLYGLGTIIGAGIYVLIGKIVGTAGIYAPAAFLLAGIIAAFTAFSYAELATRFPKSAAAAVYVDEAWRIKRLSSLVGWIIIITGTVSAAAMANGLVGYVQIFFDLPRELIIGSITLFLMLIALWGIRESAMMIVTITLLEIGGLIFVLFIAQQNAPVYSWEQLSTLPNAKESIAIILGGFLAFYAFIGFEDMANVVEETQNPRRNIPIAIILAVSLSTIIYVTVAITAVRTMSIEQLSNSAAPLADMVTSSGYSAASISLISLIAVVNGALVQIIMASRVMYGMGKQQMAPAFLSYIHPKTHTPVIATIIVALAIFIFALWLPLVTLAKLTSLAMLIIFSLVNGALITVKRRQPVAPHAVCYPIWIPVMGGLLCVTLILVQAFAL